MEYSKLIAQVIDAFHNAGKDYPIDLLYPVPKLCENNRVMDLYMECNLQRDPNNGRITEISDPTEIYMVDTKTLEGQFVSLQKDNRSFTIQQIGGEINVSAADFTEYYMEVREFAFSNSISEGQRRALRNLITIYTDLFEEEACRLYHRYSGEFFDWAYAVLTQ